MPKQNEQPPKNKQIQQKFLDDLLGFFHEDDHAVMRLIFAPYARAEEDTFKHFINTLRGTEVPGTSKAASTVDFILDHALNSHAVQDQCKLYEANYLGLVNDETRSRREIIDSLREEYAGEIPYYQVLCEPTRQAENLFDSVREIMLSVHSLLSRATLAAQVAKGLIFMAKSPPALISRFVNARR